MAAEMHQREEELGGIPDSPPPAVLAAVEDAWDRIGALEALDRTLRFAVEADRGLAVEVRTREGGFIRRVSSVQALELMSPGAEAGSGSGSSHRY